MEPVAQFLIAVAAIFLIGAIGEIVFERTFIPDAIWLIATGVLLGPILGWVSKAELNTIAPYFAALTLVIVLFEGGSRIKLKELAKVAPRAGLLAILSFVFAVAVLTLVVKGAAGIGWLPESWTWSHAILVACILGGPSSIIIMPAMERAKLAPSLANLVGLESAITDAFCVVGTAAMIDIMVAGSEATSPGISLLKSFGLALVIGMVSAFAWMLFLRLLKTSEHAYPITLAVLLLLYVAIDSAGGSAALGILCVAIMLGNAKSISSKFDLGEGFELGQDVRGVHSRIAFIIKSLFFTFMGMMLGPPWGLMALGAVLAMFIGLARVPAGLLATIRSEHDEASKKMVVLSLPRGMAAGVLATMPAFAGVPDTEQLPVFVFSCIVTTILLFAAGFPIIRKQLPTQLAGELGVAAVEAGGDAMAQAAVAELQAGVDEGPPEAARVPTEEENATTAEPNLLDVPQAPPVVPVFTTTMMSEGSTGPQAMPSSTEPQPATLASPVDGDATEGEPARTPPAGTDPDGGSPGA